MWNPGRPSAIFASTSTRTPSRPNSVPERALASTRPDITLVCLSALASTGRGFAALQLAQGDQALDQEVQDQQSNDDSLVAACRGGQHAVDGVESGGDPQRQQGAAHREIAEQHQDRPLDSEDRWQDLNPGQCGDESEHYRQSADDVESDVGVPIASPKVRLVKALHRDPRFL